MSAYVTIDPAHSCEDEGFNGGNVLVKCKRKWDMFTNYT